MTIRVDDLIPATVGELFDQDLRIPLYQRPYRWQVDTVQALLDDIWHAWLNDRTGQYALGSVILCTTPNGERHVVDGQQRLLSLRLLVQLLRKEHSDLDNAVIEDQTPQIVRVHHHMRAWVRTTIPEDDRPDLLNFIEEQCVLVQVVTDDEDEAFRFFDSQNYRGKPLKPHDLLKAHHLRTLGNVQADIRTAIVRNWESVDDQALANLFNRYLYRIAQWSRGRPALRELRIEDIGLFKGIETASTSARSTPAQAYHLEAQRNGATAEAREPYFPSAGTVSDPAALRARFQLDAPIIAGANFFERVNFLMQEQRALQTLLDEHESRSRFTRESRYHYVTELFLTAMLYWTNKFYRGDLTTTDPESDPNLKTAWDRLYIWAYGLRLKQLRVTWASVNVHSTRPSLSNGKDGLFTTLREDLTGTALNRLLISLPPIPENHDQELSHFLCKIEGREA